MREAPKCLEAVNGLGGSKTRFHSVGNSQVMKMKVCNVAGGVPKNPYR